MTDALKPERHAPAWTVTQCSARRSGTAWTTTARHAHACATNGATTMTITTEQHDILRHSLGLGRSSREYRNHFVTGPGSTDYPHCEALVAAGLMRRHEGHALTGGDPMYVVTDEGKTLARLKTPNSDMDPKNVA